MYFVSIVILNYLMLGKHSQYSLKLFLFVRVFLKCWDSKVCQSPKIKPAMEYCPNRIPCDFLPGQALKVKTYYICVKN